MGIGFSRFNPLRGGAGEREAQLLALDLGDPLHEMAAAERDVAVVAADLDRGALARPRGPSASTRRFIVALRPQSQTAFSSTSVSASASRWALPSNRLAWKSVLRP